jgi:predicted nucleic acid-binding protein
MEPALLGLVLDTSVLVSAERRGVTVDALLEQVRGTAGEVEIAVSALTVAELVHGFYRATTEEIRQRRRTFIEDLKSTVPVHPITETTSEIIGRIGAEQAAKGIQVPLGDLLIGASALEQGYGVGTSNLRHFRLIPGLTVIEL